ncbi:hypothetical protein HHI36_008612 [Cryptolaemus montrouzieri]|uniref:Uncharacterized protein n=1 Tax=Cryptolaemus montrouzieri TaxID=559131 RepID=A0ABD2MTI8_9CUCU
MNWETISEIQGNMRKSKEAMLRMNLEEREVFSKDNKQEKIKLRTRRYKKYCEEQRISPLSICSFMDTIAEMNLAIHRPKKDQCDLCCSHKVEKFFDEEYNAHIIREGKAR